MKEEKALTIVARNAVLLCERSLEGEDTGGGDIYVDGASNILTKPDFVTSNDARTLSHFRREVSANQDSQRCVSHDSSYTGDVHVVIGREHPPARCRTAH
jgi:hypothetical protein